MGAEYRLNAIEWTQSSNGRYYCVLGKSLNLWAHNWTVVSLIQKKCALNAWCERHSGEPTLWNDGSYFNQWYTELNEATKQCRHTSMLNMMIVIKEPIFRQDTMCTISCFFVIHSFRSSRSVFCSISISSMFWIAIDTHGKKVDRNRWIEWIVNDSSVKQQWKLSMHRRCTAQRRVKGKNEHCSKKAHENKRKLL